MPETSRLYLHSPAGSDVAVYKWPLHVSVSFVTIAYTIYNHVEADPYFWTVVLCLSVLKEQFLCYHFCVIRPLPCVSKGGEILGKKQLVFVSNGDHICIFILFIVYIYIYTVVYSYILLLVDGVNHVDYIVYHSNNFSSCSIAFTLHLLTYYHCIVLFIILL